MQMLATLSKPQFVVARATPAARRNVVLVRAQNNVNKYVWEVDEAELSAVVFVDARNSRNEARKDFQASITRAIRGGDMSVCWRSAA